MIIWLNWFIWSVGLLTLLVIGTAIVITVVWMIIDELQVRAFKRVLLDGVELWRQADEKNGNTAAREAARNRNI